MQGKGPKSVAFLYWQLISKFFKIPKTKQRLSTNLKWALNKNQEHITQPQYKPCIFYNKGFNFITYKTLNTANKADKISI